MQRFLPEVESLAQHEVPAWYRDAKLGIFVHWYPSTVPAFAPLVDSPFELADRHGWAHALKHSPYAEWYQNSLSIPGSPVAEHHAQHWPGVPYDEFVRRFVDASDGWDPKPWADLFAQSGARYVVHGSKHHDGVTMWPSRMPNPFKGPGWSTRRNTVTELADAVRAHGLRFGLYYSGGLDWTFGGLPIDSFEALIRAIPQGREYAEYADGHWRELIDLVGPDVLWNDIGYPLAANGPQLIADYYNQHPDGVINDRFDVIGVRRGTAHADFVTPEFAQRSEIDLRMWETCRGIGKGFGYNALEGEEHYLSVDALVSLFVDVVAKGGNLLLNVGPTARGEIPAMQAARLAGLGWWLRTNGEAIYGTRPWVRAEGTTDTGQHVRFTTSHGDPARSSTTRSSTGTVYAIVLGTPVGDQLGLDLRPAPGAAVRLLGHGVPLEWTATDRGCTVRLPEPPAATPAVTIACSAVDAR